MKTTTRTITIFLLTIISSVSFSFKSIESEPPSTEQVKQLVADWERAKAYSLEYLKVSTDEAIAFKPTPEMRTFGQQFLHLTEGLYVLGSAATGKTTTVTFGSLEKSDQYNTKAALTKAVTEGYDFIIAGVKGMNDQQMPDKIKVFDMDITKGLALSKVFEHQTHHRGQTTVYLRLKGITPPNEMLF
ncbi:MAG: DinB family protein [Chryseolinea sp.]